MSNDRPWLSGPPPTDRPWLRGLPPDEEKRRKERESYMPEYVTDDGGAVREKPARGTPPPIDIAKLSEFMNRAVGPSYSSDLSVGERQFDSDLGEHVRRLAVNAVTGAQKLPVMMGAQFYNEPAKTVVGLAKFPIDIVDRVSAALGGPKGIVEGALTRNPLALTPSLDSDVEQAREEIYQAPQDIILAALPFLKAAFTRAAKVKSAKPVEPIFTNRVSAGESIPGALERIAAQEQPPRPIITGPEAPAEPPQIITPRPKPATEIGPERTEMARQAPDATKPVVDTAEGTKPAVMTKEEKMAKFKARAEEGAKEADAIKAEAERLGLRYNGMWESGEHEITIVTKGKETSFPVKKAADVEPELQKALAGYERPVVDTAKPKEPLADDALAKMDVSETGTVVPKTEPGVSPKVGTIPPTESAQAGGAGGVAGGGVKPTTEITEPILTEPGKIITPETERAAAAVEPGIIREAGRYEKVGPEAVGLNKAEIDHIRATFGFDDIPQKEVVAQIRSIDAAKRTGADKRAMDLADELIYNPHPIDDVQHGGMVLKMVELQNDYKRVGKELVDAYSRKNMAEIADLEAREVVIRGNVKRLVDGSENAGTELGRGMSMRKAMVNLDSYDLESVIRRATQKKGSKLTPREYTEKAEMAKKYKELEDALEAAKKQHADYVVNEEKRIAELFLKQEAFKSKIGIKTAKTKAKHMKNIADIEKAILELGTIRMNELTGVSAEGYYLLGRLAKEYIHLGANDMKGLIAKMRAKVPDISDYDVYQALASKSPAYQKKAATLAQKNIKDLETQARLLLEIQKLEEGVLEQATPRAAKAVSPEVASLTAQRNTLKKQLRMVHEIEAKAYNNIQDGARLENAIKKLDALKAQLKNNYRDIKKHRAPDSAQLAAVKDQIAEVRKIMRIEDQISNIKEQIRTGDFVVSKRISKRPVSPEVERRQVELNMWRRKLQYSIDAMEPWWKPRKLLDEGTNTLRTLKATADLSATLRQGLLLTGGHPVIASKAFTKAVKAAFSEYTAEQIDNAMRSVPHHYLREKAKLELTELGGKLTQGEEYFMGRLVEKMPGYGRVVRGSERHMVTHLNLLRTGVFDDFLKRVPNATPEELRAVANWINVATGRGSLKSFSAAGRSLGLIFFAPRFAASRIQAPFTASKILLKYPRLRGEIVRDIGGLAGIVGGLYTLGKLGGMDIETDYDHPEWGKLKVGDTYVDILGGLQQPMRMFLRIGEGTYVHLSEGKQQKDPTKFRTTIDDPLEIVGSFMKYKLSPAVTTTYMAATGKDVVGNEVTPAEIAAKAAVPMLVEDIYDAWKLNGPAVGVGVGVGSTLGLGMSSYPESERRRRDEVAKEWNDGNYEKAEALRREWNIANPDKVIGSPTKARREDTVTRYKELVIDGKQKEADALVALWNKGHFGVAITNEETSKKAVDMFEKRREDAKKEALK